MRKLFLTGLLLASVSGLLYAQDFDDDIYYNPKKTKKATEQKTQKKSNYIADFANLDVDTYNRRGQYYVSPVDTIGQSAENGEDFVYTQQIQKYYNPTIVVDNADVLADVLNNSYGNVEIVLNDGRPYFAGYNYGWPYSSWYNPWRWSAGGWGWGVSWYDPWYSWGPSWSWGWGGGWYDPWYGWGPSWSWGWGPSWSWGPGWGWGGGYPSYAHHRPAGARPVAPAGGWASDTRVGNYAGGGAYGRPSHGLAQRPGASNSTNVNSRPGNHHRTQNFGSNLHGMQAANGSSSSGSSNNRGYNINSNGHRAYNSGNSGSNVNNNSSNGNNRRSSYDYNRSNNSNNSQNNSYNRSNSSRTNSYGSGSYNSGSRGSFGGGGGSRGRHR